MKQNIAETLKKVLRLPPEARAAIAGSLLDSLDQTVDEDAEFAWETEILLRIGGQIFTGCCSKSPIQKYLNI